MKSHMLTQMKRRHGSLKTFAGALLSVSALVACDADRPDPAPQKPKGAETVQSQTPPPNDRQASDLSEESRVDSAVQNQSGDNKPVSQFAMIESAVAEIGSAEDQSSTGSVAFKPGPNAAAMQVIVRLEGLEPGPHGFHIHSGDACWEGDEFVAGSHFNPYEAAHGGPTSGEHHVGDMGNITADADGEVSTELTLDYLAFSGPANILQRAVVIHSGEDDLSSQPSGDAGNPVACGIIFQEREVLADPVGEQ